MKYILLIALALCAPLIALSAPLLVQEQGTEKHLLRLAFQAGTVAEQFVSMNMGMSMNMGAQEDDLHVRLVTKATLKTYQRNTVKAVKEGAADIEQEITRIKAVMDNPMMKLAYDSAVEDPNMFDGLADVVGQKIALKLSDTGKTIDIKMPEGLKLSDMEQMLPEGLKMSDMEQMLQQALAITALPQDPVAIGDTWTVDQAMPMGQMVNAESKMTFKLVAVDDEHYTLELTMDIEKLEMPPGMELEKVTASGNVVLNRANGLLKNETMSLGMKMTMTGQGSMAMNMEVKVLTKPAQAKTPSSGMPAGRVNLRMEGRSRRA